MTRHQKSKGSPFFLNWTKQDPDPAPVAEPGYSADYVPPKWRELLRLRPQDPPPEGGDDR